MVLLVNVDRYNVRALREDACQKYLELYNEEHQNDPGYQPLEYNNVFSYDSNGIFTINSSTGINADEVNAFEHTYNSAMDSYYYLNKEGTLDLFRLKEFITFEDEWL